MVKTQTVNFKDPASNATMTVTLFRGRKEFSLTAKMKLPDGAVKPGCRNWFKHEEEEQAVAEFEKLIKDSLKEGWVQVKTSKKSQEFDKIPPPPGAKTGGGGNGQATPKSKK